MMKEDYEERKIITCVGILKCFLKRLSVFVATSTDDLESDEYKLMCFIRENAEEICKHVNIIRKEKDDEKTNVF